MRIIARRTLQSFLRSRVGHKDFDGLKAALDAWYASARKSKWRTASDVRRQSATASIVSADRIVFNIKGNDYRLVVSVDFESSTVWIKWLGTHRDYDRIDARKVEHDGRG